MISSMHLFLAVFFALLSGARAYCPNSCSGHGSCGSNDRCTCYLKADASTAAWTGADCSQRTCPEGKAWAATATKLNEAHPTVECSAKGICDRETGSCVCAEGFEGVACERAKCENDCSGNGFCYTLRQLANLNGQTYSLAWDAEKEVGCLCDAGFRGVDCSLRECPTGADVMGGDDNNEGRDCSGRGICDYETGLCSCFIGFYGTRCENQTILG